MTTEQFGPYELDSRIGQGGMGEVYRAIHVKKRERGLVAVKRLPAGSADDADFRRRFRREAALDAAHATSLVHRDVKPANVLLHRPDHHDEQTPDFVYLIDFGIAANLLTSTHSSSAVVGTAAYMAPEQFVGDGDHRVDVYALGCLLHQLLTGSTPFAGNPWQLMAAHKEKRPPRPSIVTPHLPATMDEVVLRALSKNPDHRQPSARQLAADARRAVTGPAAAPRLPLGASSRVPAGAPSRFHVPTSAGPVAPPVGRPSPAAQAPANSPDPELGPRFSALVRGAVVGALAVAVVAVGLLGLRLYLGQQYYVGTDAGRVVIYQGVRGSAVGVALQQVAEDTGLRTGDLAPEGRASVDGYGLDADGLDDARRIVDRLRSDELLPTCRPSASGSGQPVQVPGRDCRTVP